MSSFVSFNKNICLSVSRNEQPPRGHIDSSFFYTTIILNLSHKPFCQSFYFEFGCKDNTKFALKINFPFEFVPISKKHLTQYTTISYRVNFYKKHPKQDIYTETKITRKKHRAMSCQIYT